MTDELCEGVCARLRNFGVEELDLGKKVLNGLSMMDGVGDPWMWRLYTAKWKDQMIVCKTVQTKHWRWPVNDFEVATQESSVAMHECLVARHECLVTQALAWKTCYEKDPKSILPLYGFAYDSQYRRVFLVAPLMKGTAVTLLGDSSLTGGQRKEICESLIVVLLEALKSVIESKVIHGGLETSNVFYQEVVDMKGTEKSYTFKLGGFGLSRFGGDGVSASDAFAVGKQRRLKWMSPSYIQTGESTHESDGWSVVLACWSLLAKSEPFATMSDNQLEEAIGSDFEFTNDHHYFSSDHFKGFQHFLPDMKKLRDIIKPKDLHQSCREIIRRMRELAPALQSSTRANPARKASQSHSRGAAKPCRERPGQTKSSTDRHHSPNSAEKKSRTGIRLNTNGKTSSDPAVRTVMHEDLRQQRGNSASDLSMRGFEETKRNDEGGRDHENSESDLLGETKPIDNLHNADNLKDRVDDCDGGNVERPEKREDSGRKEKDHKKRKSKSTPKKKRNKKKSKGENKETICGTKTDTDASDYQNDALSRMVAVGDLLSKATDLQGKGMYEDAARALLEAHEKYQSGQAAYMIAVLYKEGHIDSDRAEELSFKYALIAHDAKYPEGTELLARSYIFGLPAISTDVQNVSQKEKEKPSREKAKENSKKEKQRKNSQGKKPKETHGQKGSSSPVVGDTRRPEMQTDICEARGEFTVGRDLARARELLNSIDGKNLSRSVQYSLYLVEKASKNEVAAFEHLMSAARLGCADAWRCLGEQAFDKGKMVEAESCLIKADTPADMYRLGQMFKEKKNDEKALKYFKMAADKGITDAKLKAGELQIQNGDELGGLLTIGVAALEKFFESI